MTRGVPARLHVDTLTADAFATGKALFRRHEPLSFVDAATVAYAHAEGLTYLYAFDAEFDAADEVTRVASATNPFDPE
jgi:predicted nucleic acid-binding protein